MVCKGLGVKFLWVDCLCIVQNGTDNKTQLGYMGYIYGGAQCTIVAGHGNDADAGLPGISNISRKRQHFHANWRFETQHSTTKCSSSSFTQLDLVYPWLDVSGIDII